MVDAFSAVFQRPNFFDSCHHFSMGLLYHGYAIQSYQETYRDVFGTNQRDFFPGIYQCEEGSDGSRAVVNHGSGPSRHLCESVTSCLDPDCYCGWRSDSWGWD